MITEIGIVAGSIWHALDKKSPSSLKELMSNIDAPRDLILMSLGWLAREGHVTVLQEFGDYTIRLIAQ